MQKILQKFALTLPCCKYFASIDRVTLNLVTAGKHDSHSCMHWTATGPVFTITKLFTLEG